MKYLKYMLFISLIFIFSLNVANATSCTFGTKELYFECTTGSKDGTCTVKGTESSKYYINPYFYRPPENDVIEKCEAIYSFIEDDNNIVGFYNTENPSKYDLFDRKNGSMYTFPKMDETTENDVYKDLTKYNGKVCSYNSNDGMLNYKCTIAGGNPTCYMSCISGTICENRYSLSHTDSFNSDANNFINSQFEVNGAFACPTEIALKISGPYDGKIFVYGVITSSSGTKFTYVAGDATNISPTSNSGPNTETTSDFDPFDGQTLCSKNAVKGSFRIIGWIILILEIVVPIIIILMSSVDLFKVIVSSKQEDFSKTIKSFITRLIAGIIIFFVPMIANFVIKNIGGDDVYSSSGGSFYACTYCMLNPTDDTCGKVISGD